MGTAFLHGQGGKAGVTYYTGTYTATTKDNDILFNIGHEVNCFYIRQIAYNAAGQIYFNSGGLIYAWRTPTEFQWCNRPANSTSYVPIIISAPTDVLYQINFGDSLSTVNNINTVSGSYVRVRPSGNDEYIMATQCYEWIAWKE